MLVALTRPVSDSLEQCALTHQPRHRLDVARARRQHAAYEEVLRRLGASVVQVAAAHELPDAVFIEDTAVVLDELAVITHPGAASRRAEPGPVAATLQAYRPLAEVRSPGTVDGGDVLRVDRTLYVGRSSRTNDAGIAQLAALVEPFGYAVHPVEVRHCLHLKSAVSEIGTRRVLANPAWVSLDRLGDCEVVAVDPSEPAAANALRVEDSVVFPAHHPATLDRLRGAGVVVVPVECDELAKAEGGVTCCSLLFRH